VYGVEILHATYFQLYGENVIIPITYILSKTET